MAITDYKMTADDISKNQIRITAPNRLEGNPEDVKQVFDRLPLELIKKYNPALDVINTSFLEQGAKLDAINENLQDQIDNIESPAHPLSPKGMYATVEDLEDAHQIGEEGDAWLVGDSTSNVVYMWDSEQEAWVNIGTLTGGNGFNSAYNRSFELNPSNLKQNGTASAGVLNTIARADHVHPSDERKADLVSGFVEDDELLDEDTISAWNEILGIS